MAKDVTMRDIAVKVGVSTVTVSKALTDREGVSNEMRGVIKKVAEEMGYHYSIAKKPFQEGRSYNIGVLVESHYVGNIATASSFYLKMYHSVVLQLSKFHYSVILEVITPEMFSSMQMPNILTEKKVDGIIVLGKIKESYLKPVRNFGVPVTYLDFYDNNMQVPSVIPDNVYGAYVLANYLIKMGHKKLAFVGTVTATPSILDRFLGFYRSILEHHLTVPTQYVIPDRGEDGLNIEIKLPLEDMPTAFACNCDETAYILMEKLQAAGFKIPEDISVVGFDNYAFASYAAPKLTTIEVDMDEMARQAVEILISLMKGECVQGRKVVGGRLIIGESVRKLMTE